MIIGIHSRRLVALATTLVFLTASAHAQVIRWASDANTDRPAILHAPDNAWTTLGTPLTVRSFGRAMRYSRLGRLLGVSEDVLRRADVIAFEGNGGSGAGPESGWESSTWTFSDGTNSYVASFNEAQGSSSDPSVIANGSIVGPDGTILTGWMSFNTFFGMCPSEYPGSKVVSFILFDLDAVAPEIDTASPQFSVTMVNGYRADGAYGEGTPDPDAVGIFSSCSPHP